jgi:endonuclease YncB( thermonuclease family)
VGVADGDTIAVLDANYQQHKIRLNGIDAPEKGQAFGNVSKQNLSRLVFGKDVTVEWHKRDRYGRLVGKVLVEGADANLDQVRQGLAWVYVTYLREVALEDREAYLAAERRRSKRSGYGAISPVPPWKWRRRGRYEGSCRTARTNSRKRSALLRHLWSAKTNRTRFERNCYCRAARGYC